jgi:hypothetical protein
VIKKQVKKCIFAGMTISIIILMSYSCKLATSGSSSEASYTPPSAKQPVVTGSSAGSGDASVSIALSGIIVSSPKKEEHGAHHYAQYRSAYL